MWPSRAHDLRQGGGDRAVHATQVDLQHPLEGLARGREERARRRRDPSVRADGVERAEALDDLGHGLLHHAALADVPCERQYTVGRQRCCGTLALRGILVEDRDVGSPGKRRAAPSRARCRERRR